MAIGVMILGESGTGKTFSIKTFSPDEVKILSVSKPILPFRGKYEVVKTPTSRDVIKEMKNTSKKNIVIDDFQYILGLPMMKRMAEKGWEKFNDISQSYYDILDEINNLPDDVIVYFTSHVEVNEDGKTKIKTIGKALDKYITIEGLFMIVFGTVVIDQKYFFTTQNSGNNTVKTPDGMFDSMYIPNDLKYVSEKIRNFYYMDGAKTDEEIKIEDESHAVSEEVTSRRRARKTRHQDAPEDTATESNVNTLDIPFDVSDNDKGKIPYELGVGLEEANAFMNEQMTENIPDAVTADILKKIEESGDNPKPVRRQRRSRT